MFNYSVDTFSKSEAIALSGLSRQKFWRFSRDIITPYSQPPFGFTYNQLIAFRAIYSLRRNYTHSRIKVAFGNNRIQKQLADINKIYFLLFSQEFCFVVKRNDDAFQYLEKYLIDSICGSELVCPASQALRARLPGAL